MYKNKILHHDRYHQRFDKENVIRYYTWCDKMTFNDLQDDPDGESTTAFPSKEIAPDMDLSEEARLTRRNYHSCQKCLKARVEYYGYEYMNKLGFDVEKWK